MEIVVGQESDGFYIEVGEKRWRFDQEDSVEELVNVFKYLGHTNVVFEESF